MVKLIAGTRTDLCALSPVLGYYVCIVSCHVMHDALVRDDVTCVYFYTGAARAHYNTINSDRVPGGRLCSWCFSQGRQ